MEITKQEFIDKFKEYDDTDRKIYMKIDDRRGFELGGMTQEFYSICNSTQMDEFLDKLYNKFERCSSNFNNQTRESFSFSNNECWVDCETNEPVNHFYHSFNYCLYEGCNGQISFYIRFVDIKKIDEFLSKYKEPYRSMAYKMVESYHGRMSDTDLIDYMYYNEEFYGEGNSIYDVLNRNWYREWDKERPSSPESVAHYDRLLPESMKYTKGLILKELENIGYVMSDIDVIINKNELTVKNTYLGLQEGFRACSTIKTWTESI